MDVGKLLAKRLGQYGPGLLCECACVAHAHSSSREIEKLFEEIYKHFSLKSALMTTTSLNDS